MARSFPIDIPHSVVQKYGSLDGVRIDARSHAKNRMLHCCEAIALIGGLARTWTAKRMPMISIGAALVQDARARDGHQAAHILPGQIMIDGQPVWAAAKSERERAKLLARCMVTSQVPTPFNRADSAAESAGLVAAFCDGCRDGFASALSGQAKWVPLWDEFLRRAQQAFSEAEDAKLRKDAKNAESGNTAASDERLVEALILREYQYHGVTGILARVKFPSV